MKPSVKKKLNLKLTNPKSPLITKSEAHTKQKHKIQQLKKQISDEKTIQKLKMPRFESENTDRDVTIEIPKETISFKKLVEESEKVVEDIKEELKNIDERSKQQESENTRLNKIYEETKSKLLNDKTK